MTTYSSNSDFSTDAASTVTDSGSPTAVTDWTWRAGGGNWDGTITTGGDEGGRYFEYENNGTGDQACLLSMDGPGSIASAVETDVLFRFRLNSISSGQPTVCNVRSSASPGTHYVLRVFSSGNARLQRYTGISASAHVGGEIAVSISAGTWYWARINVTTAGSWKWRVWSGAVGDEPGSWDMGGATDTTQQTGYVGPGATSYNPNPTDYDWFSCGTAGDDAPSPGGGPSGNPWNYYAQQ